MRHPGVIKYIHLFENSGSVALVCEPVLPLNLIIGNLSEEEICLGFYSLVEAIRFLRLNKKGHFRVVDGVFASKNGII
jgi:hypothetical protein